MTLQCALRHAVEYARALTLMEQWRSAPSFAMAANRGPLTERIIRVLGLKKLGAGMRGVRIHRQRTVPDGRAHRRQRFTWNCSSVVGPGVDF